MENCKDCPCQCKLISNACILKYSFISNATILTSDNFTNATDDIDDLLGIKCAEELCTAVEAASVAAETNGNNISDNLSQKWLDLLNNRHFKKWYANRLVYHWLNGTSISEIAAQGIITTSNNDSTHNNEGKHASESERRRLQKNCSEYAEEAKGKFINYFWKKNLHKYPCFELDCGCCKEYKCKDHQPPRKKIGMFMG